MNVDFFYFHFCVNCYRPSENTYNISYLRSEYACECGKINYSFIITHTEEEYTKLEEEYQEKYLNLKRKKKFERIL